MNAWFYLALLLLFTNIIVMFVLYVRMKDRFSRERILGEIKTEIDKLILDLGRETDRDVALLEDRIRGLRELMDEADRRILLANREESKRQAMPELPVRGEKSASKRPIRDRETLAGTPALFPEQADSGPVQQGGKPDARKGSPVNAGRQAAEPDTEPVIIYTKPRITRRDLQLEPDIPVKERVLEMARKDISPEIIAKTLGISQGEVDLILAMNGSSL